MSNYASDRILASQSRRLKQKNKNTQNEKRVIDFLKDYMRLRAEGKPVLSPETVLTFLVDALKGEK